VQKLITEFVCKNRNDVLDVSVEYNVGKGCLADIVVKYGNPLHPKVEIIERQPEDLLKMAEEIGAPSKYDAEQEHAYPRGQEIVPLARVPDDQGLVDVHDERGGKGPERRVDARHDDRRQEQSLHENGHREGYEMREDLVELVRNGKGRVLGIVREKQGTDRQERDEDEKTADGRQEHGLLAVPSRLHGQQPLHELLVGYVGYLEGEGKAGSYIKSIVHSLKAWLSYNNIKIRRKIHVKNKEYSLHV